MLVNHPNMDITELPTEYTVWNTLPRNWGRILTERMGFPMSTSKGQTHWYAKLDGLPIHIKCDGRDYQIETRKTQQEAIAFSIKQELNNGTIITQQPVA